MARTTTTLRMPDELHAKIEAAAQAKGCSANRYITDVIEASFDQPVLIDQLAARIEQRQRGHWSLSPAAQTGHAAVNNMQGLSYLPRQGNMGMNFAPNLMSAPRPKDEFVS
jgi:predicted DNA-binding protein